MTILEPDSEIVKRDPSTFRQRKSQRVEFSKGIRTSREGTKEHPG